MFLNLTIAHHIYLTHEQRYSLHAKQQVIVVGVSIPVWTRDKVILEPNKEVFCQYVLKNSKKNDPIKILRKGYEIVLPYRPEQKKAELSNDEWMEMSMKHPNSLDDYYSKNMSEISSKNLLDIKDGGATCLSYREHGKIINAKQDIPVLHYICIERIETLLNSLI